MRTVVVVPVRDQPDVTLAFLRMLAEQAYDELVVMDNGSRKPTRELLDLASSNDPRVSVWRRPRASIYELWNQGFEIAVQSREETNVLVTNNDVELGPGALDALGAALRSKRNLWAVYPDYEAAWPTASPTGYLRLTRGVLGDGGMSGACFMLAGEKIPWRPLVSDTRFEWWFGDNHLAREIEERGGLQARVLGLPIRHEAETTARHHPELETKKLRDRARWQASERDRRRAPRGHVPGTILYSPGGARREE